MPQNRDIMKALAQQQGKDAGAQRDTLDIIREAAGRESNLDFDTFIRKLYTVLEDPNNRLVQFGNTVFLMKRVSPDTAEVHTFSSEPPQLLVQRFTDAASFLKTQGMKRAVTYADNPAYLKIAKATGLPVKTSRTTRSTGGQALPAYQFEVTL